MRKIDYAHGCGFRAYECHLGIDANPYEERDKPREREAWFKGWRAAQKRWAEATRASFIRSF